MVYTLTLNPALDYVMKLDNLRFDDINRSYEEKIYFGGKGINVSVILSRLGVETRALGFIGGFSGGKLEEMLKCENIDCDFCRLSSGNTRINVKIKYDSELDINADGPTIDNSDIENLFDKIKEIKDGDYFVLAGSIPKSLPEDIYERIIQTLKDKKVNIVVDATNNLLLNILKYKPFLIKPNHHELGDMFGVITNTDEEIIEYSKKLQDMGARNVLVSRAKDGALLLDENGKVTKIGIAKGKLVNSVGCGDSMVAGFVAGYILKNDYEYALKLGTACGGATAFSPELATKEEILFVFDNEFKK